MPAAFRPERPSLSVPVERTRAKILTGQNTIFMFTRLVLSCIYYTMKTVTLTDEAYIRLKEWKDTPKESFSHVVLKRVPQRGTLGQMVKDIASLPALSPEQARVMKDSITWGRDPERSRDPWTS